MTDASEITFDRERVLYQQACVGITMNAGKTSPPLVTISNNELTGLYEIYKDVYERLVRCERHKPEWEPIETAPTDGTWIILLFKDEDGNEDVYDGFHSLRAWRTRDHVSGDPIAWMPLPKPHKEEVYTKEELAAAEKSAERFKKIVWE